MTDLPARLIARLDAELDNVEGVENAFVSLMLSQADAARLLQILKFVEDMRIETIRGASRKAER